MPMAGTQNSKNGSGEAEVDVLGLGNSCLDQIFALGAFPRPGASMPVKRVTAAPGGQAASTLVGCQRLGLTTRFVLRTGDDAAGARQVEALTHEGVDLTLARTIPGVPSAAAYILLNETRGQRTVIWNTDPRLAVAAEDLPPGAMARAKLLYIDGKDGPACLAVSRQARALGRPVVSDIDTPQPWTRDLIASVSDCICSREFLAAFFDGADVEPALRRLAAQGPHLVCATLGDAGALAFESGRWHRSPAFPVAVVDDTGAGDAFRAGYIYALLAGWSVEDRLRFANATAACACGAVGAVASMPRRGDVVAMLRRFQLTGPWELAP